MICTNCSQPIRPVVAIDIDGTLADYHHSFTAFCTRYFGLPRPKDWWDGMGEMENYIGITKEQYREAKLAYRQGGNKRWATMFPEADRFVDDIASVTGAEIWLTTTRPWLRLDNIDPDTREWLSRHRIQFDGLLYDDNKYKRLAERMEPKRIIGVIDDLAEMLSIADVLDLPTFQIARDHNRSKSSQWSPRGDYSEALEWIVNQMKEWNERSGNSVQSH